MFDTKLNQSMNNFILSESKASVNLVVDAAVALEDLESSFVAPGVVP